MFKENVNLFAFCCSPPVPSISSIQMHYRPMPNSPQSAPIVDPKTLRAHAKQDAIAASVRLLDEARAVLYFPLTSSNTSASYFACARSVFGADYGGFLGILIW